MQKRGLDIYIKIISLISNNDKLCAGEINKRTNIAHQHIKKAIDFLEDKKVLRRVKSKGKRKNLIVLKKDFVKEFLDVFGS